MGSAPTPDAQTVATFLAKRISKGPGRQEIAEAISEVELETQTKGSSFIKIHFIDPEWDLIDSGLFDRNSEGLLPEVEVEFPQRTGWLWVLCACEPSNELSGPNFTCTFEPKIVRTLKNKWGAKRAEPGYNTAAEFVKALCIEAGIKYHIPSAEGAQDKLNKRLTAIGEVQRELEGLFNTKTAAAAEEAFAEGNTTLTPEGEAAVRSRATKEAGIGAGSGVTVKGAAADSEQIATMNEVMGIANGLKAGQLATEALITACIVESEFRKNAAGGGLLQFEGQTAKGLKVEPGNVGQEVDAVLQDPGATGIGGMISLARKNPTYPAWKIAQLEQGSGAGKATEGASNYGPWVAEARKIIIAYGGVKASAASGASTKQGQVERGTTQNPSENSWDCITRLGSARNFSVFATPTTLFYIDGPELVQQQRAAAYVYPKPSENKVIRENAQGHKVTETGVIQIPLNGTFDNTSVEYFEDHKIKGKVQKHSRVGRPQSPSEIRINIVCEPLAYEAGLVLEVINGGPLKGRWIIVDATRNYFKDKFTQLLLEPPSAPILENEEGLLEEHPAPIVEATTGTATGTIPAPASGSYRNPPAQGTIGIGSFQGFEVALWIIPELEYAQKNGWTGRITSGYRPGADPNTATGASEHSGTQYPHGAVDFGGPTEYTNREAFFAAAKGYTGLPLIPAQFTNYQGNPSDGGHASGTGH